MFERTEKHLWVYVWLNCRRIELEKWKVLIVLEETEKKEVGGGTRLWVSAKTNSKLLWGMKWVPINHPLLSECFFILSFTHFRSLHPERLTLTYKASTFKYPYWLTLMLRRTCRALTSPWLKKKHIVVTMPPSRLPLEKKKLNEAR